jgi:biotin--protein ligase
MQCWRQQQQRILVFTASVLSCVIPACAWMQASHVWPSLAQPVSRALRVRGFVAFPTRQSPPAARRASRSLTMSDRPAVHVSCASVRDWELLLASAAPEDLALLNIEGGAAGVSVCDKAADAVLKPTPEAPFDASQFHSFLALRPTRSLGRVLLHAETLSSTQELLFDQCRSPPDGLLCIADRQTKGKGRGSNEWASPAGCLCFSFVWSVADAALLPFFQYIVSMALHRAVAQEAGGDAKRLGLRLKWPNDIYIVKADSSSTVMSTKTKIGGVLCQSTVAAGAMTGKPFRVVAGVGVNVLNSQPTTCLRDVVAQHDDEAAAVLSRERIAAAFCFQFEQLAGELESKGFNALVSEYLSQWMHSGQEVEVQIEDKSQGMQKAVIVGLAPSGFLRAVSQSTGQELELHPDGNSLDMMQGLIYTKR